MNHASINPTMFRIKRLVDDPEWQELRGRITQTWKSDPVSSFELLRNYLGDFSDPIKIRKVENYLTGIRLHKLKEGQVELCDLINKIAHKQNSQSNKFLISASQPLPGSLPSSSNKV